MRDNMSALALELKSTLLDSIQGQMRALPSADAAAISVPVSARSDGVRPGPALAEPRATLVPDLGSRTATLMSFGTAGLPAVTPMSEQSDVPALAPVTSAACAVPELRLPGAHPTRLPGLATFAGPGGPGPARIGTGPPISGGGGTGNASGTILSGSGITAPVVSVTVASALGTAVPTSGSARSVPGMAGSAGRFRALARMATASGQNQPGAVAGSSGSTQLTSEIPTGRPILDLFPDMTLPVDEFGAVLPEQLQVDPPVAPVASFPDQDVVPDDLGLLADDVGDEPPMGESSLHAEVNAALALLPPEFLHSAVADDTTDVCRLAFRPRQALYSPTWNLPPALERSVADLTARLQGRPVEPVSDPLSVPTAAPAAFDHFTRRRLWNRMPQATRLSDSCPFRMEPPQSDGSFPAFKMPSSLTVSKAWLLATEELCRTAAVASGQALASLEVLASSLPEDSDSYVLAQLLASSLSVSLQASTAAAFNHALIRRDVLFSQMGLPTQDARRARTAPLLGHCLVSPNPSSTSDFLMQKRMEETLSARQYRYFDSAESYRPTAVSVPPASSGRSSGLSQQQPFRAGAPSAGSGRGRGRGRAGRSGGSGGFRGFGRRQFRRGGYTASTASNSRTSSAAAVSKPGQTR